MISESFCRELLVTVLVGNLDAAIDLIAAEPTIDQHERATLLEVAAAGLATPDLLDRIQEVLRIGGARWEDINEFRRAAFYARGVPDHYLHSSLFCRFASDKNMRSWGAWVHLLPELESVLTPWVGKSVTLLELGTHWGGRLESLRALLGEQAVIVSVDRDAVGQQVAPPNVRFRRGDIDDPDFLASLVGEFGAFDVVLEDVSHKAQQQARLVEEMLPHVRHGGVYVAFETQTSYQGEYVNGAVPFTEWCVRLVDDMHAWNFSRDSHIPPAGRLLRGIDVRNGMLVLHRSDNRPPFKEFAGRPLHLLEPYEEAEAARYSRARQEVAEAQRLEAEEQLRDVMHLLEQERREFARLLEQERQRTVAEVERYERSLSWRSTAGLRRVSARLFRKGTT